MGPRSFTHQRQAKATATGNTACASNKTLKNRFVLLRGNSWPVVGDHERAGQNLYAVNYGWA